MAYEMKQVPNEIDVSMKKEPLTVRSFTMNGNSVIMFTDEDFKLVKRDVATYIREIESETQDPVEMHGINYKQLWLDKCTDSADHIFSNNDAVFRVTTEELKEFFEIE